MDWYILYGNNRGMKLLDESTDEKDIIDTLGSYLGCLDTIDYIIVKSDRVDDVVLARIKSYEDYIEYKRSYRAKVKRLK